MSFHTNRNDVIETGDDIQDVLGIHVAEENGQKVATIKVLLDPRKDFLAVKEFFLHFTNGINHRLVGPFAPVSSPADLPSVPVVEPEASNEATQPLVAPIQAKKTAELSPDDSTTADTAQLPTVPDTGKKGK